MSDCKAAYTPMETGLKLMKYESKQADLPYQNLIGALMYLSVATRPDITHAVSYLSQFNNCYGEEHWKAAKRILRYLQGTKDYKLKYEKINNSELVGYADADWAACQIDRRSYTGYCFIMCGGAISWESRKQKTIALSTAEAEYMSLTECKRSGSFKTVTTRYGH
ncbi:uncharacterized protein ACR2FA_012935 [Aphomia sociella]